MENQEQAETTTSQPELTVTDLANIRAIIDVAVRRGAFGAAEASGVGTVFDKLNTFLNAVSPQKTEEQPAQPESNQ
jgi:hypothetical protein